MADYIPDKDAEAIAEGRVRVNYALAHLADLKLKADDVTPLETALNEFETAFNEKVALQAQAEAGVKNTETKRAGWERFDRAFNGRMQAELTVTDEQRAAMMLRVRDTVPTEAALVETHPVGQVDTSQKLRHVISWRDSGTPNSKARPDGVWGCEIYYKIGGTAPVDHKECQQAAMDRSSPYLFEFEGENANKTVWYLLRWIMNSGEKGAWSPLFSATVTG